MYDYIDSHVRYFDKMYAKRLRTYRKTGFSIWTQELQPKQIINAIFDSVNYTEKFEQDIVESEKMVVISSPDIRQDKIDRFLLLITKRQEVGVKVTVITTDPEDITYGKSDVCYELIRTMQLVGINVITRTEVEECFAVIDDEIVWHGGMNLLGKADVWDNLMRIRNSQVATELLEIALGCSEERRKVNKKIKCDIYTRVSTTMQVDGYSLDAQKEKLKRYAEFQNMEIVNEYSMKVSLERA